MLVCQDGGEIDNAGPWRLQKLPPDHADMGNLPTMKSGGSCHARDSRSRSALRISSDRDY
jgi:hypothetical protein